MGWLAVGAALYVAALAIAFATTRQDEANGAPCPRDPASRLVCLVNGERADPLSESKALMRSARRKAADLRRCGLSHTACGRPFDAYADRYVGGADRWLFGENLARAASAHGAVAAWLGSRGHREAMRDPRFEDAGGARSGRYWVLHLGAR